MSEDATKNLSSDDKLDLILAEIKTLNVRVAALEAKSYDTRPIWERALAEILELKERQSGVETGLQEVRKEVRQFRRQMEQMIVTQAQIQADIRDLDIRVATLEEEPKRPS